MELLAPYLERHPYLAPRRIVCPDYDPRQPLELTLQNGKESWTVTVEDMAKIWAMPQYEKLFLFPEPSQLCLICRFCAPLGVRNIWLDGNWPPPPLLWRKAVPDFFDAHASELADVYSMLATDIDRHVFAARIKAILTGNAGYLPVSDHEEYHHPLVHPKKGDIMIDGGLSDMVSANKKFAEIVGNDGLVLGFEPIAWMANSAREQLSRYAQYKVISAGLGEKKGHAHFADAHDSSHICNNAAGVDCDIVSIDEIVASENLRRVDLIKLDVEGSELSALRGATKTISAWKPSLVICLYHSPADLFLIPLYIKSLVPEYRLHVAHSSSGFTDTILYAHVPA